MSLPLHHTRDNPAADNISEKAVLFVGYNNENPEGKRPLGRPRRRWEKILRWIFRKLEGVVGTGWSWLRIGTGGGHLWVR